MNHRRNTLTLLVTGALLTVLGFCTAGCSSTSGTASGSFASVIITNRTAEQIRAATVGVFQEDGYTTVVADSSALVFEQQGSTMSKVAYGNWVGGAGVYIRVKASIVYVSETTRRLQCHAYTVRNKGDSFFEEEFKVAKIRSGPYQKLLDKVAKRLN